MAQVWDMLTTESVKKLRAVKRAILARPNGYRQDKWHCGSAMCLAGHVAMQSGLVAVALPTSLFDETAVKRVLKIEDEATMLPLTKTGELADWEGLAWQALGLPRTFCNSTTLFKSHTIWPHQYQVAYDKAKTRKARAQVAAARIEHFIRTGE